MKKKSKAARNAMLAAIGFMVVLLGGLALWLIRSDTVERQKAPAIITEMAGEGPVGKEYQIRRVVDMGNVLKFAFERLTDKAVFHQGFCSAHPFYQLARQEKFLGGARCVRITKNVDAPEACGFPYVVGGNLKLEFIPCPAEQ